ncbi:MAG: cobyrinate a,c-diamide synthase [marine bacterium B5-7]|nr:MAG: cobyrinate a,c-diamide synthase [marine bacterium B5-7]
MAEHEFLISAAHKSSGKTILSIGLIRAMRRRGLSVQPGKKGPDYIDPMWLASAADKDCYNYDFNTQDEDEICDLFAAADANVRLIEGNKGLYDSVDVKGRYSNAALSRLLDVPVVLVIDCEGITRGLAPLICGYRDFEEVRIAGVILNKIAGSRHESKLRAAVEHYTDIPVFGAIPRNRDLNIDERHLGLVPSNAHAAREEVIELITDQVVESIDLDALLASTRITASRPSTDFVTDDMDGEGIRLAVARDSAFGFYYADDMEYLRRIGVQVEYFSPIADNVLPEVDGLFLGGGFPECFATELADNTTMRESVRRFATQGGVVYAECGGLMYLGECLIVDGTGYPMANVLPITTRMQNHPAGRGLVEVRPTIHHPWLSATGRVVRSMIQAHEFHYSHMDPLTQSHTMAYEVERGQGIDGSFDGIVIGNTLATYLHQRHTRSNPWIQDFIGFIQQIKRGKQP